MKKRVLIVDDCPDTRAMFCEHMEQLGADVVTAGDGSAAIDSFENSVKEKRPFNLILLDIRMPKMNGVQAAKTIRSGGFKGIIAACTAASTGEGRKEGKEAGIDVYLDKMVLKKEVFEALLNKV
jgi:CheY-like chemotaxis protein